MIDANVIFWIWCAFGASIVTILAFVAWCLWGIHDSLRWQEIERARCERNCGCGR